MSVEDRIRYLMRAALRAEREGADRAARALRRMAEDARPLDAMILAGPAGTTSAELPE